MSAPPVDPQTHLIYLLLDSNLPTGGFVASSGLESWAKHGFLGSSTGYNAPPLPSGGKGGVGGGGVGNSSGPTVAAKRVTEFLHAEVENYARSTGVYVKRGWEIVRALLRGGAGAGDEKADWCPPAAEDIEETLRRILALDQAHEATLLSHVSRRASKAQGVAILTLYTKGLSRPPGYDDQAERSETTTDAHEEGSEMREKEETAAAVVEGYKRLIRKGTAPGHLAVCWGLMTAGLGLSLEKSYHLYLFLHARSVLSAAVRLNLIGPYLSSQLLLHPAEKIIATHTGTLGSDTWGLDGSAGGLEGEEDFWDWTHETESGPATTWPLGEVLIARHDLQHSRIFNS